MTGFFLLVVLLLVEVETPAVTAAATEETSSPANRRLDTTLAEAAAIAPMASAGIFMALKLGSIYSSVWFGEELRIAQYKKRMEAPARQTFVIPLA